jgi:hypothetical protein
MLHETKMPASARRANAEPVPAQRRVREGVAAPSPSNHSPALRTALHSVNPTDASAFAEGFVATMAFRGAAVETRLLPGQSVRPPTTVAVEDDTESVAWEAEGDVLPQGPIRTEAAPEPPVAMRRSSVKDPLKTSFEPVASATSASGMFADGSGVVSGMTTPTVCHFDL